MVEQKADALMDPLGADQMVVIEQQHDALREGADVVEQRAQQGFDWHWLRRMQQHERVFTDLSVQRLQRRDEVGPEERGLIIALIEGHPCRAALSGLGSCKPLSKQRRLAETSRRR